MSALPVEVGGGPGRSSASQSSVDNGFSSTASGHGQGSGGDTHRTSSGAKEAPVDHQALVAETPELGALGTSGVGGSAHGHAAPMSSTHLDSAPEPAPNSQLKELSSPRIVDTSASRLLAGAMHGDLRVGVHTEAFGRVTIQTNAQGGQLSAQLSLENSKEGATLAAHLPGLEQKIVQQHGLNASVRLVNGFDARSRCWIHGARSLRIGSKKS